MKKVLVSAVLLASFPVYMSGQGSLKMPQASQKAEVKQRIGLTDISLDYHSPLVKGRVVWGELVPFGEVWRGGANENTVIRFSTDVLVEGKPLSAGNYGLHMIPRKDKWTIIFSKNYESWGSFFYNQSEDALRVDVVPEISPMQEWLSYRFTDLKASSAKVMLNWEKIGVGFMIEVDLQQTVLASVRTEMRGVKYYSWDNPWQAADYCLRQKINLDEALKWVDVSIENKETFLNLNTKSELLSLKGETTEAQKLKEKALQIADEGQLNLYGYRLLGNQKTREAIDLFRLNVQKYPDSWNVYDSLAEAYELNGNFKEALENYNLALSKAPEGQRKRINDLIQKIQKKI